MTISDGRLTISSSLSGAEIYYTADGSVPTRDSVRYEDGIVLEPDTTYRARVYAPSYQPGTVAMLTYTSRGNVFTDVAVDAWCYDTVDAPSPRASSRGLPRPSFRPIRR